MAVRKSGGLGRGLEALFEDTSVAQEVAVDVDSSDSEENSAVSDAVSYIEINEIKPNLTQPRKQFDEAKISDLAESIKKHGMIQPIIVRPISSGEGYEIVAGERRWRAARDADLRKIPCIVRELTDRENMLIAIIENMQREDLNPIEEAHAYERLIQEFNLTQDEVAERVSKSRTTVTNALRLLKLTEKVQQMLIDDMLSTGHVRALITIADPQLQYETAMYIFDKKLSVRETESYVKKLLNKKPKEKTSEKEDPELSFLYKAIENRLKESLGTKTTIKAKTKDSGKIEIEYYSQEDLERITQLLAQ